MTAHEHASQTGHDNFRKRCSVRGCEGGVVWETRFNWFCQEHRPWHPFWWRTEPTLRVA